MGIIGVATARGEEVEEEVEARPRYVFGTGARFDEALIGGIMGEGAMGVGPADDVRALLSSPAYAYSDVVLEWSPPASWSGSLRPSSDSS